MANLFQKFNKKNDGIQDKFTNLTQEQLEAEAVKPATLVTTGEVVEFNLVGIIIIPKTAFGASAILITDKEKFFAPKKYVKDLQAIEKDSASIKKINAGEVNVTLTGKVYTAKDENGEEEEVEYAELNFVVAE